MNGLWILGSLTHLFVHLRLMHLLIYSQKSSKFSISVDKKTRPDTWLPKSGAGGQGPYLRSPDHMGRSKEGKVIKS